MNRQNLIGLAALAALVFGGVVPAKAAVVASDNANNGSYTPQPDNGWAATNGGSGYNLWTPVGGTGGGGTYMEGVGVNGRQVDGSYSFALFAGSGGYAISRPLSASMTAGEFEILSRFDTAGSNLNLINLRSGNNTSGFGAGELLSFGLVNNNQLSYTDASGLHTLASGEARGARLSWDIRFNATAGTYSGTVTNLDNSYLGTFSGNLEPNGTSVGSFAVINTSTGGSQNVIFDAPTFITVAVPEPGALVLAAFGLVAISGARRLRR